MTKGHEQWTQVHDNSSSDAKLKKKYSAELNKYVLLVRVICEKYRFRGQVNIPRRKGGS